MALRVTVFMSFLAGAVGQSCNSHAACPGFDAFCGKSKSDQGKTCGSGVNDAYCSCTSCKYMCSGSYGNQGSQSKLGMSDETGGKLVGASNLCAPCSSTGGCTAATCGTAQFCSTDKMTINGSPVPGYCFECDTTDAGCDVCCDICDPSYDDGIAAGGKPAGCNTPCSDTASTCGDIKKAVASFGSTVIAILIAVPVAICLCIIGICFCTGAACFAASKKNQAPPPPQYNQMGQPMSQ